MALNVMAWLPFSGALVSSFLVVWWLASPFWNRRDEHFETESTSSEVGNFAHEIEHEYAIGALDEADYRALMAQYNRKQ